MYRTKPNVKGDVIYEKIYHLILYPSMMSIDDIKTTCASLANDYIIILHNRDIGNGLPKQEHFHVLIRFDNPRSINSVSRAFGVGSQLVNWANDFKGAALYLFHLNDKSIKANKPRYDFSEAITNISNLEEWLTESKPVNSQEAAELQLIVDHIDNDRVTNFIPLLRWCIANGLSSTLRRNASLIRECVFDVRKEFSPWTGSF